jgi:hypothetical protein
MKALFISPNAERLFMPTLPLGLALVAAATRRAGHETRFHIRPRRRLTPVL